MFLRQMLLDPSPVLAVYDLGLWENWSPPLSYETHNLCSLKSHLSYETHSLKSHPNYETRSPQSEQLGKVITATSQRQSKDLGTHNSLITIQRRGENGKQALRKALPAHPADTSEVLHRHVRGDRVRWVIRLTVS